MTTKLAIVIADFETQLTTQLNPGDVAASLLSALDDDGIDIPNGIYFFTIDGSNSQKEHIVCTVAVTDHVPAITAISSVSRQGVETSGAVRLHRVGASVTITDWAHLKFQNDLLKGTTGFNSSTPLFYDANFTPTLGQFQIPTWDYAKAYMDTLAINGSPDASTILKGIGKITTTPATVLGNPTITIASPAVITLASHGLIAGDTVTFSTSGSLPTGISAATTYYVISAGLTSSTFEIALTSGGTAINTTGSQSGTHTLTRTTPFFVGNDDPRMLTQGENDAAQGTSGTPSNSNRFVTQADTSGTGAIVRQSVVTALQISNFFGNGADGAYTLDGTQAAVGGLFSKVGSVYTLLRDAYFTDLTIAAGVTLEANSYIAYCSGTFTNALTAITRNNGGAGGNATAATTIAVGAGGTAGAATNTGSLAPSIAGKAGANGTTNTGNTNGTAGGAANPSLGVNGSAGGASSNDAGISAGTGGAGGTATAETLSINSGTISKVAAVGTTAINLDLIIPKGATSNGTLSPSAGSGSGAGGGSNSASAFGGGGGGSGASGGIVCIIAKTIVNAGTISANGGAGGTGSAAARISGAANGGGGGAGGSGGIIIYIYASFTETGSTTVTGGTGAAGALGAPAGVLPPAATAGVAGSIYKVAITY